MKKRAIIQHVAELRVAVYEAKAKLDEVGLADMANKLAWLHERVDMLASKLERMRGDITLDDAAAKRLTFAVGQFSARLDRLERSNLRSEQPMPKPRKRKPKPEPTPATPNGEEER